MKKSGPGAQSLPTNKKPHASFITSPTLAGKKGVSSMGVPEPQEKDFSKRTKMSESPEKIFSKNINTSNMSKSLFEKLFEDVMGGEADLDLSVPASDESALGIEHHDDASSDEVTLTLDRATAEKLHSMLGELLGGDKEEEFESEEDEDMGGEDFGGEGEDEGAMKESIEVQAEPKELKSNVGSLQKGKPHAIGGSTIASPSKGKAELGKVEADGEPKPLSAKADTLQKHAHGKVASKVTSGTGKSLFDV